MADDPHEKLREVIATRINTDYPAAMGTLPLQFPNRPKPQDAADGYIAISWQVGTSTSRGIHKAFEQTPVVIFGQVFVPKNTGTKKANQEAGLLAQVIREQRYTVISNTPSTTQDPLPLDGANQRDTVTSANLRVYMPTVNAIGPDQGGQWYQVNMTAEALFTVKYGETV